MEAKKLTKKIYGRYSAVSLQSVEQITMSASKMPALLRL